MSYTINQWRQDQDLPPLDEPTTRMVEVLRQDPKYGESVLTLATLINPVAVSKIVAIVYWELCGP